MIVCSIKPVQLEAEIIQLYNCSRKSSLSLDSKLNLLSTKCTCVEQTQIQRGLLHSPLISYLRILIHEDKKPLRNKIVSHEYCHHDKVPSLLSLKYAPSRTRTIACISICHFLVSRLSDATSPKTYGIPCLRDTMPESLLGLYLLSSPC